MHFRCVFTLLQYCVLVGLNWAEPMMYFNLHVTCSCIFHAYVPSILYILIYCFVGVFLIVSLSLSLSLFLALVCFMAPKSKSTSSQNLLHFGASTSSFDPTPSHVWFRDNKARKDFSENFSQQGIHLEHQVILSDFSNIEDRKSVV